MIYYILFNQELTATEAVIHFLITIFVFMISLSIHEFAHAFSAYKMGDSSAKDAGRMTLNPFKHLNFTGFLFFMVLGVGWANPVPINPLNFKRYKRGTRWVSISGILANFLLGLLASVICAILIGTVGFGLAAMEYVYSILFYFMMVNSFLALFNLLPLPPLDGYNFMASFMKPDNKFLKFVERRGMQILLGVLVVSLLIDLLLGIDILSLYLSLLYDYLFLPISFIGF